MYNMALVGNRRKSQRKGILNKIITVRALSNMGKQRTSRVEPIEDLVTSRREVMDLRQFSARPEHAEDELDHFFAQSPELLCIADLDGYFKRLNPAWTTCLGWTPEELRAQPFLELVHPDDREATVAEFGKLGEGVPTILFESRCRRQDGSYRWLQWDAWTVPGRPQIYATALDVTQQKHLEREILEIVDREKERLGRELHDGLCQTLAGIAALSATLSRKLAASSEPSASAAASEIAKLLNQTIVEARDLARGLGPVGLREVGLDGALEALARNVQQMFRISCTLECHGPFQQQGSEVEQHLFRITQEAVNNAVIHSKGDRIEISLGSKDGEGFLSVRDNGVGVPEEAPNPNGIGRHTMAYRARLIGASLEVRGRAGGGRVVSCAFPLPGLPDDPENIDHARNIT
jgi:PAS domain S-box-containing protein